MTASSNPAAVVLPLAATLGAMAAFQAGAAVAKGLFPAVGPEGAATLRLALGAALLVVIDRPWRNWPKAAPLVSLVGLGLAAAGAILMFYLALGRLAQGIAIALQFLGPLGVALFGSRKLSHLLWAGLAAAGVWLLVGAGVGAGPIDGVGVAFALGAAVCWAAYILFGRRASAAFGRSTAALAVTIAAAAMAPIGLWRAGPALLAPNLIPLALLVAVLATVVPFSLEIYAIARLPVRAFATFTSLEPAFGVLAGFAFHGERLAAAQLAGVVLVIGAAAGAAWQGAGEGGHSAVTDAPPT